MTRTAELENEFDKIIKQCRKDLKGGLSFGMDWPTLRALWPERFHRLQEIQEELAKGSE